MKNHHNQHIAKRLKNFDSSAISSAFSAGEKIKNPIDLSIGFPEDPTAESIKNAAVKAINQNFTRYTSSNGIIELRSAIAKKLKCENGLRANESTVSVVPGLTTGVLMCYLALLDPGDEILLPDPYFPPYKDLAALVGAKPVLINTFPDFQLTAEKIKPYITPRSKVLIINSPNNPTGAVYPRQELEKIAMLAKQHSLIIISDEIYEYFAYDTKHFSIGSIYPKTLTLNGFSKAYAMTGWRIGYIAGPLGIIKTINELLQYAVFSTNSISQKAALAALQTKTNGITKKYHEKRDLTLHLYGKNFKVEGAQGAFYTFVKLPKGITDLKFVELAAKKGVIILPGRAFSSRTNYVRIAYCNNYHQLIRGIEIINKLVD